MRQATVLLNGTPVGVLTEENRSSFVFRYDDAWFLDHSKPPVSLTLPKNQQEHRSEFLFPFFFNLLSEGANRNLQARLLRVDETDSFGLLLATAQFDTIGPVTIQPMP